MKTLQLILFVCFTVGFPSLNMIKAQNIKTFVTSDGETLYYTSTGKGQRVLMLPPGPGASVNVIKSWADSLSKHFECILLEQRGTGLSSNVKLDSTTINLKRAVNDIEDLRVHLGKPLLMICGISWGGALAQAYAASYPLNVKKIILVSSLGPDRSLFSAYHDNGNARKCQNEIDSLEYWNKQPDSQESSIQRNVSRLAPYFFDRAIGKKVLQEIFIHTIINPQMSNLMWKDLNLNYDVKSTLKDYKGQCIVIKPRQDIMPEEMSYQIKDVLPQTKFIVIEQCGHFPDMEKPKEFFPILKQSLSD